MDPTTFSFITCINDDYQYQHCLRFISALAIPTGYKVELIALRDATSMASGYNEGMRKAIGKYKIYLHQDVYLLNTNLLSDLLSIFKDESIGLVGVIGSKKIPYNLVWWETPIGYGQVYEIRNDRLQLLILNEPQEPYEEVILLDGLILITQFDIPWRSDILDGWHFYDFTQCLEFRNQNKKVVIPYQKTPWAIHDCKDSNLTHYYRYRDIVKQAYFKDINFLS